MKIDEEKVSELWELLVVGTIDAYLGLWKELLAAFVWNIFTPTLGIIRMVEAVDNFRETLMKNALDSIYLFAANLVPSVPGLRTRIMTLDDVALSVLFTLGVTAPGAVIGVLTPNTVTVLKAIKATESNLGKWKNLPKWFLDKFKLSAFKIISLAWSVLRAQILGLAIFGFAAALVAVARDLLKNGSKAFIFSAKRQQKNPRVRHRPYKARRENSGPAL